MVASYLHGAVAAATNSSCPGPCCPAAQAAQPTGSGSASQPIARFKRLRSESSFYVNLNAHWAVITSVY